MSDPSLASIAALPFRPHQDDETYLDFVAQTARVIAEAGKKPLLLGGDHLVTLAALRGLARAGLSMQVVQLDAHHDYAPPTPGARPTHATFVRQIVAERLAKRVLEVGVRGLAWGDPRLPRQVSAIALSELPSALLPDVDVYLTIDTDAFDPAIAPAVGYPEPEGLPFAGLGQVLAHLGSAGLELIGADWTEYNPRFDTGNQLTGLLVVRGLAMLLQRLAQRGPRARQAVARS